MDISLSRKTPPKEMDKASDCDGVTADTLFRLARVELVGMVKDDSRPVKLHKRTTRTDI